MNHELVQDIVTNPEDHSVENRRTAEGHIAACPDCRAYAEGWRRARLLLSEYRVTPSENFVQNVMERIGSPVRSHNRWWAPAAALALAAAAGLFAILPQDRSVSYEEVITGTQLSDPIDVLEQIMEEA